MEVGVQGERLSSLAAEATEVTELIVYVAGEVAPASVAVTTLESELVALSAWFEAVVPSEVKLAANPCTVDCNCPSALSCDRTVES